jgi:hypothetical protein
MTGGVNGTTGAGVPTGPAWRRATIRTLMAAGVAMALLAAAEFALRICLGSAHLTPPLFRSLGSGNASYALRPDVELEVRQFGRSVHVSTDTAGRRRTANAPPAAARAIHLVGDSQVFGWGLSDEETIASRLQTKIGVEMVVVNHGVPGYGPDDYFRVASSLPPSDLVVVVHTEENDASDAYGVFQQEKVTCGFLATWATEEGAVACFLMNQRVFQMALSGWNGYRRRYSMTPLGFSESSVAAGKILHHRIANLDLELAGKLGDRVLFTVIPWKGRYSPSWRGKYSPLPGQDATMPSPFTDDISMGRRFSNSKNPVALYHDADSHLSPAGAEYVAQALAEGLSKLVNQPH